MRKAACLMAAAVLASAVPVVHGQAGDLAAIQGRLNSQFKLTTTTADRSDIVTAGDVVVIHKPGLLMYAVASPMPPSNSYKNGKIGQGWGGFGKDMMITMATPGGGTAANYPHRPFVPEEKCWITGIQVQKDGVLFQLYSDPYDDIRYYSNLKIPFPNKKEVPPVDAAVQLVAEVLTVVPPDNQAEQSAAESASRPATNPAQGTQQTAFSGQYSNLNPRSTERFLFLSDGSFTKFVGDGQGHGQFSVNGDTLTLTFTSTGSTSCFKIQGDKIFDCSDARRGAIRTGNAPTAVPEAVPAAAAPPPPAPATDSAQAVPQPAVSGKYRSEKNGAELVFVSDTSVILLVPGTNQNRGQYSVNADTLTIKVPIGHPINFKIQGDRLVSDKGTVWVRQGGAPAPVPVPAPAAPPAPAPASMPDIAPPPPPADASPPTISIGQTKDQVTAGFGQPLRVAKLGAKEIFYYKDMKVTFTNGKVSNVE